MNYKVLLLIGIIALPISAKPLGTVGQVFPIAEMDMLDWINARLAVLDENGEMDKMKNQFKEQVKQTVQRPKPVDNISTTTSPRSYLVDPSLTLSQDIKDANGNILFPKGLRINPFDASTWPNGHMLPPVALSKTLVFFDGDDKQQLSWAVAFQQSFKQQHPDKHIKWILTKGAPEQVANILQERIYFDQGGNITRNLKINHIPTTAEQAKTNWQITEFDVSLLKPYEGAN